MAPQGGMVQIELRDGSVNWTTSAADRPLLLDGDALVAQIDSQKPGSMALNKVRRTNGEAYSRSVVTLPEAVTPLIDARLGQQFSLRQNPSNSSQWLWRQKHQVIRGAAIAGNPEAAIQVGMLTYTGRQLTPLASSSKREFEALWRQAAGSTQINTGTTTPRLFASINHAHTLTSTRASSQSAAVSTLPHRTTPDGDLRVNSQSGYWWHIADAAGNALGRLSSTVAFSPFVVSGDLLLNVAQPHSVRSPEGHMKRRPMALIATQISSGAVVWQIPIRDTRYRGPYPT